MRIQLQSIMLPDSAVCDVRELYYHENVDEIIFDGYFNGFYLKKRRKYCSYDKYFLRLHLHGYEELMLFSGENVLGQFQLESEEGEYVFELPETADATEVCFSLKKSRVWTEADRMVSGYYEGEISEAAIHNVRIAVDICTYKREGCLLKTIQLLQERVLERTELQVSDAVDIYIIDNAGTLVNADLMISPKLQDRIFLIPNKNVGGSGGFTRGMLEVMAAKKQRSYTHILLMDDDARPFTDMLLRLYGILRGLRPEWLEMTIGGSLLSEETPWQLSAAGEWWENGYTAENDRVGCDLRNVEEMRKRKLSEPQDEYKLYSGWWLCCYSLRTVREDNLPCPFFLHHDDIEYGMRNAEKGIAFFNGINVWHRTVMAALPGVNSYYDTRNSLHEMAMQNVGISHAVRFLVKKFMGCVLRYEYCDAALVVKGIRDYRRGLRWLVNLDAEAYHGKLRDLTQRPIREAAFMEAAADSKVEKLLPGDSFKKWRQKKSVLLKLSESHGLLLQRRLLNAIHYSLHFSLELFWLAVGYKSNNEKIRSEKSKAVSAFTWKYMLEV